MISIEPGLTPTGLRRFPIGFRLEFLREWDACLERGAKTRLLRENDLTWATVKRWIEARRRGELEESMTKAAKAGKSSASVDRAELARLRVENERLRRQVGGYQMVCVNTSMEVSTDDGCHGSEQGDAAGVWL